MDIFTVEQAALKLGVKPSTVRKWIREGQLKGFKMSGRLWRIRETELNEFINHWAEQSGLDPEKIAGED